MSQKEKELRRLLECVRALGNTDDPEQAHAVGDSYLIDALELMAKGTRYRIVVDELVDAYYDIPKWYA